MGLKSYVGWSYTNYPLAKANGNTFVRTFKFNVFVKDCNNIYLYNYFLLY